MSTITIIKQDHKGSETWRYSGSVISRQVNQVKIEAYFDREDFEFEGITLKLGDRFIETYFGDRWYNIFEIHEQSSKMIKCWYCNISYPAVITGNSITYRDLALDLLVYPDGKQKILDQDEFASLPLSPEDQQSALKGLTQLQRIQFAQ